MATKSVLDALIQHADANMTITADTFQAVDIQTGISTAARYGWMINRVEWNVAGFEAVAPTVDAEITMQLVQGNGHTAVVLLTDDDLICQARRVWGGVAASTAQVTWDPTWVWNAPDNLVVVDPTIQFLFDGTNTGVNATAQVRLYYQPLELSEMDILRMIAQR